MVNFANFDKYAVATDIVIFTIKNDDLKVLLIKRKNQPFKNMWAIPGGFVRQNESVDVAAIRELKEETGVSSVYIEQLYTYGEIDRDPRGRVISVAYFAILNGSDKVKLKATTDALDVGWFSVLYLPDLAFDHKKIIEYAKLRLKYKLEYTVTGFQLIPREFTLSELQKVYEIVLGHKFDKRNFWKKIKQLDIVESIDKEKKDGAHRPAKIYKLKREKYTFPRSII